VIVSRIRGFCRPEKCMSFPILVSVLASICPEWITNSALRRGPFSPGGNGLISMPGDANAVDSDALTFAHGGAALRVTEGRAPVGYDPVFLVRTRKIRSQIPGQSNPESSDGSRRPALGAYGFCALYAKRYTYTLHVIWCTLIRYTVHALRYMLNAIRYTLYTIRGTLSAFACL
jgi:hypothetical protein